MSKNRLAKIGGVFALFATLVAGVVVGTTSCAPDPATCEHKEVTSAITLQATCVEEGSETDTCKACGTVVATRRIAVKGHTYSRTSSTSATCETAGSEVYACATCQDSYTVVLKATGHNFVVSAEQSSTATCTTAGKTVKVCSNAGCTMQEVSTTSALTHDWSGYTCTGRTCQRTGCGATEQATVAHKFVADSQNSVAATCETAGVTAERCSICKTATRTETIEPLHHQFVDETAWEEVGAPSPAGQCLMTQTQANICTRCGEVTRQVTVPTHNYQLTVLTQATCLQAGTRGYKCTACGGLEQGKTPISYTADHTWEQDGAAAYGLGATVYTCSVNGCNAQRTEYTGTTASGVDSTVLQNELTLKDENSGKLTSVKLNETVLNSVGSKSVDVGIAEVDNATLDADAQERVGNSPVYDFTLVEAGTTNAIPFGDGGVITIRLPYELQPGEDPGSITIFYINDEGALDVLEGTYLDGYVTVQTTHFSYYTVGKYTAQEICARYGHNYEVQQRAANCVLSGYYIKTCTRCGDVHNDTRRYIPALGHTLVRNTAESKEATCTVNGLDKRECSNDGCDFVYTNVIAATGHVWQKNTDCKAASCTQAGYDNYTCATCQAKNKVDLPQLPHSYDKEVVKATCTTIGYTTYTCSMCKQSHKGDFADAMGHSWDIASPTCGRGQHCLVCNTAGSPATGSHNMQNGKCAVCGYGCAHELSLVETQTATCTGAGYSSYKCTLCQATVVQDYVNAKGHAEDALGICTVCNEVGTKFASKFAALYASLKTNKYSMTMDGLKFTIVTTQRGETETVVSTADANVQFILDGEKMIFWCDEVAATSIDGENNVISAKMYGDGTNVYIYNEMNVEGASISVDKIYLRVPYESILVSITSSMGGIVMPDDGDYEMGDSDRPSFEMNGESAAKPMSVSMESGEMGGGMGGMFSLENIQGMITALFTPERIETITSILSKNTGVFTDLVGEIFSTAFTRSVDGTGVTRITVNLQNILTLNERLYSMTAAELIDSYLGKGALENIVTELKALESKKLGEFVSEIFTAIQPYGIEQSFVFDLIDSAVIMFTGNEQFSISAMLSSDAMGGTPINDLLAMIPGFPQGAKLGAMVDEYAAMLKEIKVYEYLATLSGGPNMTAEKAQAEAKELYDMVKSFVNPAFYSASIYVDAEAKIVKAEVAITNMDLAFEPTQDVAVSVKGNGTITLLPTAKIPENPAAFTAEWETAYSTLFTVLNRAISATSENMLEVDDSYFTIQNGKVCLVEYSMDNGGMPTLNYLDLATMPTEIEKGCTGIYKFSFNYQSDYVDIYCNIGTGALTEGYGHQYQKIANPAGLLTPEQLTKCEQKGYTYYKCQQTGCGHVYRDTTVKSHEDAERQVLNPGAKVCTEGTTVEHYCTVCNKVLGTQTDVYEHWLIKNRNFITVATGHGTKYIALASCGCGYEQEIDINVDEDGCWFESQISSQPITSGDKQVGMKYVYACAVTENPCKTTMTLERYDAVAETSLGKCMYVTKKVYTFYNNGTKIGDSITVKDLSYAHTMVEGSLNGPNSKHGICSVCGYETYDSYRIDEYGREIAEVSYGKLNGEYMEYNDWYYEFENPNSCFARVFRRDTPDGEYRQAGTTSVHARSYVTLAPATCTQNRIVREECVVCHTSYSINYFSAEGHDFNRSGDILICETCGLETVKGDGPTALEDLTAHTHYAVSDCYVVGYNREWRNDFHVSVVLVAPAEEVGGTERRLEIAGLSIDVRAQEADETLNSGVIVFSQADVAAYAQEVGVALSDCVVEVTIIPVEPNESYVCTIGLTDLVG